MPLDDVLPEFAARERHEAVVDLEPAAAIAAALEAKPDALTRLLFVLRGLPGSASFSDLFRQMRFQELERRPDEVIFGAAGTPWRPGGRIGSFGDPPQGSVLMALSLSAEPLGEGRSRLVTETRVQPTDESARRSFLRYWRVVGPFSALTRRRWLRGVARR